MVDFRYGPVELYLVGFDSDRPDARTLSALGDLLSSGLVRLLDFVVISKSEDGVLEITEIGPDDDFGLDVEVLAAGLAGGEDIDELAELVAPGTSAALVALELTYARTLAERLAAGGGVVLRSERIPAPVVNAVLDVLESEGD